MNEIPPTHEERKRPDNNPNAEKALDTLITKDRITQEDVRITLSTMTKNDRMSLWILTQERVTSSSSEVLSTAWKKYGIYPTVRVLLSSVLKYKSAPEALQDAIYQLSKLKFIERELALAIGYRPPDDSDCGSSISSGYKNIPPSGVRRQIELLTQDGSGFGLGGHHWK